MTDRQPVLLLHGQPGSGRDWDLVVKALSGADGQAGALRPLAIDRLGYDERSRAGGIGANAAHAVAQLDAAHVAQATLVGHSFGAAVAAWVAAEHPERVKALVLVSPAANSASILPSDRVMAWPLLGPALSTPLLIGTWAIFRSAGVRRRFERRFGLPAPYLKDATRRLARRSVRRTFAVEQRALVTDLPLLERKHGQIVAPTTIIVGSADTVVHPESARTLAHQIQGARLFEIEGGRHLLGLTHPARVAELIAQAASAQPEL